eukprot:508605-Rhodomonas_salina.3
MPASRPLAQSATAPVTLNRHLKSPLNTRPFVVKVGAARFHSRAQESQRLLKGTTGAVPPHGDAVLPETDALQPRKAPQRSDSPRKCMSPVCPLSPEP